MTSYVSEYPCIEATRCLLVETEMAMRLTVKATSGDTLNDHAAVFTEEQSSKEEWYLDFEVSQNDKDDRGTQKRFLQLRHSGTGQYLSCDDKGRVKCCSSPSDLTWWLMDRVEAPNENGDLDPTKSVSEDPQYTLISRKFPLRRLCYAKSFDGSGEKFTFIASKNITTEPLVWTLKFTSGELCFIVNPVVHHHIRCNMYGSLSLTSQSNAWEIFRFIEVGNGDLYISSWIHVTKFLSSNSDGQIYTTDTESLKLGYSERWRLESPPKGNGVYIRSVATRRYLSVGRKRSEHLWTTTKPNDYAVWHLDSPHVHIYYLTSLFASTSMEMGEDPSDKTVINANQLYLREGADDVHISSHKEGPFLSLKKENEEEWKVEVTPEGYFTFFSISHEKYLGSNSKGDVHTTTSKGSWTLWEKDVSLYGGVTFKSKEHQRFLAVTKLKHTLYTAEPDDGINLTFSWRLDPRISRIVSGGTGGYIAGAMGLTVPATMPFALLGAMEANQSTELSMGTGSLGKSGVLSQRPISAWKARAKYDPSSLPSLPTQKSFSKSPKSATDTNPENCKESDSEKGKTGTTESCETTPDNSQETNVEKGSNPENSQESNSEKETTDTTESPATAPGNSQESNVEKGSTPENSQESNSEKETTDTTESPETAPDNSQESNVEKGSTPENSQETNSEKGTTDTTKSPEIAPDNS